LLGFPLKDIKELLALRDDPGADRQAVRGKAAAQLAVIEEKIRELEAMKAELGRLVDACHGSGPAADCPILAGISNQPRPPA
jgi:DNA-binding transcriptional MerR regulator